MKVLFLTNIPSPYRVDFFNELGKYCDLTVAFEGKRATDRDDRWKAPLAENFKAIFMKGIRVKSDAFFCVEILKVLKDRWDHIVICNYYTPTSSLAIASLKLRRKRFYIEADGGFIKEDSALKYLYKRLLISSASGWFSSGGYTTRYLRYYGAKKDRCYRYPFSSIREDDILDKNLSIEDKRVIRKELGIIHDHRSTTDSERYKTDIVASEFDEQRELNSELKVVLTVGQFIHRKGIDILIQAAARLDHNIVVYIVGGTPTEEYKKLVSDTGALVRFMDFTSKEELQKYYRAADVFVMPTREDIWGLVVNEAMAQGIPVVTTNRCIAGLTMVRNGYNGFIVSVEDPGALAKGIRRCIQSKSLTKMSKNSLIVARKYTIEKMVEKHLEVFEK